MAAFAGTLRLKRESIRKTLATFAMVMDFAQFLALDATGMRVNELQALTGVPTFSPHDLRHRRASLWHLQGVPLAEAAAWLGHSS